MNFERTHACSKAPRLQSTGGQWDADGSSLSGGHFRSSKQQRPLPQIEPRWQAGGPVLAKGRVTGTSEVPVQLPASVLPSDPEGKHADSRLRNGEALGDGTLFLVKRAAGTRGVSRLALAASIAFLRVLRSTAFLLSVPRSLAHRTPANRQSDAQAEQENWDASDHGLQKIQRRKVCLRCMKTKKKFGRPANRDPKIPCQPDHSGMAPRSSAASLPFRTLRPAKRPR